MRVLQILLIVGTTTLVVTHDVSKSDAEVYCALGIGSGTGICENIESCSSSNEELVICYFKQSDRFGCCLGDHGRKFQKRPANKACDGNYFVHEITKGTSTKRREFPYMVALGWETQNPDEFDFKCGGVLISTNYVLTAAHCTSFHGVDPVVVKAGGVKLSDNSFSTQKIGKIIAHPDYKPTAAYNDIALIQLKDSLFQFPTACIWTLFNPAKVNITAIGYGHTKFAGVQSDQLLKASLGIIPNDECQDYYEENLELPNGIIDSQICAKDLKESGMDTCQGDSGSPIVIRLNGHVPYIIGITSFGQGCGLPTPGVYTRVSAYAEWIERTVWPDTI